MKRKTDPRDNMERESLQTFCENRACVYILLHKRNQFLEQNFFSDKNLPDQIHILNQQKKFWLLLKFSKKKKMKFFQLQNCSAKLLLYLHSRYVVQNKQINSFSKCREKKISWTHSHIHTKGVNSYPLFFFFPTPKNM